MLLNLNFEELELSELFKINGGYGARGSGSSNSPSAPQGYEQTAYVIDNDGAVYIVPKVPMPYEIAVSEPEAPTSAGGKDPEDLPQTQPESNGNENDATMFKQNDFAESLGKDFADTACAATSTLNEVSEEYTNLTGRQMTHEQAQAAIQAAIENGSINGDTAYVNDWSQAARDMLNSLGITANNGQSNSGTTTHIIYAIDNDGDNRVDHFVNGIGTDSTGRERYFDPLTGTTGYVDEKTLVSNDDGSNSTREITFN